MMIMRVMSNRRYSTTVDDHDIHRRSTTTHPFFVPEVEMSWNLATHGQVSTAIPITHAS
jgi:hypothetical protein